MATRSASAPTVDHAFVPLVGSRRSHAVQPVRLYWPQWLIGATLLTTVLFNPALALVNAHVTPMTGGMVAIAQALLVALALAPALIVPLADDRRWAAFIWCAGVLFVAMSLGRGALEPKYFGDVLIFPAFVVLGMRMERTTAVRLLVGLQLLLLVVGLWEVLAPVSFGQVFKVANYYVNTRGFKQTSFWASNGDLFVSSERPSGRLILPSTGWHRGSSLFLEPVSLGNWCVVATVMLATLWQDVRAVAKLFVIAATAVLLVICDGRFSVMVSILFAAILPFAHKVPKWLAATYLPVVTVLLLAAMPLGLAAHTGDDFLGRLSFAAGVLGRLDLSQLFGIQTAGYGVADSGIAYFMVTQSLFGMAALWLLLTLTDLGPARDAARVKHGASLFISLCAPISYSIFSIKTGAVLWALYGMIYAARERDRAA